MPKPTNSYIDPRPAPDTKRPVFDGGATRCTGVAGDRDLDFPLRFDLIRTNGVAIERLARTYGEGSIKYGDTNWKQGFPESNLLNHMDAHIQKHLEGDTSEDHLAHACWNLFTLMWMQDKRPDLMDLTGKAENPVLVNER